MKGEGDKCFSTSYCIILWLRGVLLYSGWAKVGINVRIYRYRVRFHIELYFFSWRRNLENEASDKSCVTIECCKYPSTADISYNGIFNKTSMNAGSIPPCEQYAVSFDGF